MRVAAIGYDPQHPAIDAVSFASSRSLLDFDAVLWRPAGLVEEYRDAYTQPASDDGGPLLSVRASNDLLADARRRRQEFKRFLDRGRILVVVPPPPVPLQVHIIEDVFPFDLLDPLPDAPARRGGEEEASRFRGGFPFKGFADRCAYSATAGVAFEEFPGEPLFFGETTGAVHGGYVYRHPGHLLLMPLPEPQAWPDTHDALLGLLGLMDSHGIALDLPPWAADFRLDGEDAARDEVRRLLDEQENNARRLEAARQRLRDIDLRKALFAGSGNILIQAVAHAFQSLGTIVLPGLLTEDSIVVEDDDRFLVVQVVQEDTENEALERLQHALDRFGADFYSDAKGVILHSRAAPPPQEFLSGPGAPLNELLAQRAAAAGHLYLTGIDLVKLAGGYAPAAALELLFSAQGHPSVGGPSSPGGPAAA